MERDTHPGLGERLAALDVQAELPLTTQTKPALTLCGELGPALLKWCDEEWHQENVGSMAETSRCDQGGSLEDRAIRKHADRRDQA